MRKIRHLLGITDFNCLLQLMSFSNTKRSKSKIKILLFEENRYGERKQHVDFPTLHSTFAHWFAWVVHFVLYVDRSMKINFEMKKKKKKR